MNALIIDDDPDICLLLESILLLNKKTSLCIQTVAKARDIFTKHSPQLIFLDYKLPDGHGFDMIPEIRVLFPHTKIIAMSGEYEYIKHFNVCETADFFILKPFVFEEVSKIINSIK